MLATTATNSKPFPGASRPAGFTAPDPKLTAVAELERAFGQSFAVFDATEGRLLDVSANYLNVDLFSRLSLCETIAERGTPEVIEEFAPLITIGVPLRVDDGLANILAVTTLLTEPIEDEEAIAAAAAALGVTAGQAFQWSRGRRVWPPHAVVELARAIGANLEHQQRHLDLKSQLADVSSHLLSTFEELSLLHRLTERLQLSSSGAELCEMAVRWIADVVPARCVSAILRGSAGADPSPDRTGPQQIISWGGCPIDDAEFPRLLERLGPEADQQCVVLNRERTSSPTWYYPNVRDLISVPIRSGNRVLGHLVAFNNRLIDRGGDEFGAIEASLLASVAAILGVHAGNHQLYQEQSDFFNSVIRALSSAIDAKDPYTCGHSDRVGRIAVSLARELGCSAEELDTIYLSGLLHDIGKIGIDDTVLRKPGQLTSEEYEHIKKHPELGYNILQGVKELDKVLPVVLHHHEAWDGSGYPHGLKGEESPKLARITAVADSIDAMGSDRPYRKGMPEEKLANILREGAGRQWDAEVVNAYFRVQDEIREVCSSEHSPQPLSVCEWHAPSAGTGQAPGSVSPPS